MSKSILYPKKISSEMDLSADAYSAVVDCRTLDNIAFQFNWSGGSTPVGVITLEGCLDYGHPGVTPNWNGITLSATLNVTGNSGSILVDCNQISAPYLRIKYTWTSGSATGETWVSGKAI